MGQQTEPQNCAEGSFSPEDKAAAVSDSEDGLVVVKILSVPMVFMKKLYVFSKNMSRTDFSFESLC